MYQDDQFHPANENDYEYPDTTSNLDDDEDLQRMLEQQKRMDKGYNVVYRRAWRDRMNKRTGRLEEKYVREKIELYSSDGFGSHIRDAETGEYVSYNNRVGTKDEDLYFKVILATGECKSKNGSKTFFFMSPHHYETCMNSEVAPEVASRWREKRDRRLSEMRKMNKPMFHMIEVK